MSNTLPPSLYVACDFCPRKSLRTDPFPRCRIQRHADATVCALPLLRGGCRCVGRVRPNHITGGN